MKGYSFCIKESYNVAKALVEKKSSLVAGKVTIAPIPKGTILSVESFADYIYLKSVTTVTLDNGEFTEATVSGSIAPLGGGMMVVNNNEPLPEPTKEEEDDAEKKKDEEEETPAVEVPKTPEEEVKDKMEAINNTMARLKMTAADMTKLKFSESKVLTESFNPGDELTKWVGKIADYSDKVTFLNEKVSTIKDIPSFNAVCQEVGITLTSIQENFWKLNDEFYGFTRGK